MRREELRVVTAIAAGKKEDEEKQALETAAWFDYQVIILVAIVAATLYFLLQ